VATKAAIPVGITRDSVRAWSARRDGVLDQLDSGAGVADPDDQPLVGVVLQFDHDRLARVMDVSEDQLAVLVEVPATMTPGCGRLDLASPWTRRSVAMIT